MLSRSSLTLPKSEPLSTPRIGISFLFQNSNARISSQPHLLLLTTTLSTAFSRLKPRSKTSLQFPLRLLSFLRSLTKKARQRFAFTARLRNRNRAYQTISRSGKNGLVPLNLPDRISPLLLLLILTTLTMMSQTSINSLRNSRSLDSPNLLKSSSSVSLALLIPTPSVLLASLSSLQKCQKSAGKKEEAPPITNTFVNSLGRSVKTWQSKESKMPFQSESMKLTLAMRSKPVISTILTSVSLFSVFSMFRSLLPIACNSSPMECSTKSSEISSQKSQATSKISMRKCVSTPMSSMLSSK